MIEISKIKLSFNKISFRAQLLISFLLLGIMIISIMVISFYSVLRSKVIDEYENQLDYNGEQLKDNLNSKMRHYEEIVNQFNYSKIGIDNSEDDLTGHSKEYNNLVQYVNNLRTANKSSLAGIKIYENGDSLYKDHLVINTIENDLEIKILNQLRTQVNNYYIKETWRDDRGQKIFSYYARLPLNIFSNESLVELLIYETDYYSLINKLSKGYGVYILSDNNYIISASKREYLGKHISEIENSILNEIDFDKNISHLFFNEHEYILKTGVTDYNQTVIISYDLTGAMKDFTLSYPSMIIIAIIVTILAFALTFILSNRLAKRMGLLTYKIKLLRRGIFDQEVVIQGNDEFSTLSLDIDRTSNEIKRLINEIEKTAELKLQAELNALMSQINRHFLFNALSSIKCLAMDHNQKTIEESVGLLASFIRISLIRNENTISVMNELKHLEAYIHFERLRYEEKINISVEMDEIAVSAETVKFILQPLVENSIYHGIKSNGEQLKVWIRAFKKNNNLVFEVEDNGNGMTEEKIQKIITGDVITKQSGFGISNINQRIKLFHGEQYGIKIESCLGKQTIFRIEQPLILHEKI